MEEEARTRSVGSALGRFRIVRCVGAGGMGVVYEAVDQTSTQRVALKTLNFLDPDAIYRLKSEFRLLAGVLHPNLVHMHELACDGENWFFVMDYIEGVSFLEYLRGPRRSDRSTRVERRVASAAEATTIATMPSFDPAGVEPAFHEPPSERAPLDPTFYVRLRRAFAELVTGVNALHALGKLHRDLKPSNVLVTPEGRVVILDFGLARPVSEAHAPQPGEPLFGTPLYMAPELFTGASAGTAADFYAVGVMLFEALVGSLPHGDAVNQLVAQKLFGAPRAPRELLPETPEDLNDLTLRLLARDPATRPNGEELARAFSAQPSQAPAESGVRAQAPFVGRGPELSALHAAFERVRAGETVIVNVCGESGIGKTRLVDEFLQALARESEALVAFGRCYEHESVPYKAFDQIADHLSSYLTRIEEGEAALVVPRDAAALTTLFPVLARVRPFASGERQNAPDAAELRLRGFSAMRELLARLVERRPLVLVVDDVQWADDDSARLFKELFAGPAPPGCLLLVTSREARPPALSQLLGALAEGASVARFEELALGGLSDAEASELATSLHLPSTRTLSALATETRGNPFFVLALSRHAVEGANESWSAFVRGWLGTLGPTSRELLQVVAVAGRPVNEAAAIAVVGAEDTTEALFRLSDGHFISAWPTPAHRLECYHDRIREAVLAELTPERLRDLHARLGGVLEARGDADAETLATHFLAAGEQRKGALYAERAADEASAALAFLQAARWYQRALASDASDASDPEHLRAVKAKLGEAFAGAGQGVTAAEWLLAAADGAELTQALKLRQRAAELLLVSGHIDAGVEVLARVLAHLRMRLAPTPKRALASMLLQRGRLRLRGLGFTAQPDSRCSPEELLNIDACWTVALGLSLVDPIRAADFQTRNLLLSLESGEAYRIARAMAMEAGFRAAGGSRSEREAAEISARALALADEVGNPHAIGLATFTAGLGRYLVGRWPEALALLRRAEAILLEQPGAIWELNASQRFQLNALTFTGDIPAIMTRLPNLVKHARERGNLYAECALRVRLGSLVCLARDDPRRSIDDTEDVMARWSQDGFHLQHYNELFAHVQAALYRGEPALAMERTTRTWPILSRSLLTHTQALRVEARHLRTRVCLSYLAENPRDRTARELVERDVRSLRKEKVPWANAFATFAEALLRARQGELEEARVKLGVAIREFGELDMRLLESVATYRLGQLVGGEEGRALAQSGQDFFVERGVRRPERFMAQYGV